MYLTNSIKFDVKNPNKPTWFVDKPSFGANRSSGSLEISFPLSVQLDDNISTPQLSADKNLIKLPKNYSIACLQDRDLSARVVTVSGDMIEFRGRNFALVLFTGVVEIHATAWDKNGKWSKTVEKAYRLKNERRLTEIPPDHTYLPDLYFSDLENIRYVSESESKNAFSDMSPKNNNIIITRHAPLVDWLARHDITGQVYSQVITDETRPLEPGECYASAITDQHVYGVLPMWLAALADTVSEVSMPLITLEQRRQFNGGDFPVEAMDAAGAHLVTYKVNIVK